MSDRANPGATTVCDGNGTCGLADVTPVSILPAAAPPLASPRAADVAMKTATANTPSNVVTDFITPPEAGSRCPRAAQDDTDVTHRMCGAHVSAISTWPKLPTIHVGRVRVQ